MAQNGNLNNNNIERGENINIGRSTILTTETTILDQGQSERDATHFRLREGAVGDSEYLTCLSCNESFRSSSLLQVYEHYSERVHVRHFSNCLYCQGKVHQYFHNDSQRVKYYHDCLRWKRGEDS